MIIQPSLIPIIPDKKIKMPKPKDFSKKKMVGRFLHLGAGVQSSLIVYLMVRGELPRADLVIFADTGNEPSYVYENVKKLENVLSNAGITLVWAKRPKSNGILSDIQNADRFASLPLFTRNTDGSIGRLKRQCTSEYKIVVCESVIKNWLIDKGHGWVGDVMLKEHSIKRRYISNDIYVESYFGITADEFHRIGPRGPRWMHAVYPLIYIEEPKGVSLQQWMHEIESIRKINAKVTDMYMTRQDCIEWFVANEIEIPGRSSCIICPNRQYNEWLDMKLNQPVDFDLACEFDLWLRTPLAHVDIGWTTNNPAYLLPCGQPLAEADLVTLSKKETSDALLFDWCGVDCAT